MNQSDIADQVGEAIEATNKAEAARLTAAIVDGIQTGLRRDGEVYIFGLGTFKIVTRKARKARNPQTGATMTIPAREAVKFRPAKDWKESL